MDPKVQELLSKPFHFVVYHVGGGDGAIGPSGCILRSLPGHVLLVVFEIRADNSEPVVLSSNALTGAPMVSVNRGVDTKRATRPFYINKFPLSSSLLKSAPIARDEDPGYPFVHRWSQNTELDREVSVPVSPIDEIIEEFKLPLPDFLSIDAQGAELNILTGAKRALSQTIMGAISEVEFSEIYARQPLFDDQMSLYSRHGMRLVEIYNPQRWHPGPRMPGQAFLTVGEALFIKYAHAFEEGEERPARAFVELKDMSGMQLLKLMAVAHSFNMLSYVTKLGQFVLLHRPEVESIANAVPLLKECLALATFATLNHERYQEDKTFFLKAVVVSNAV